MQHSIEIENFLAKRFALPVIDVRSPSEYSKGHIPEAINIPLFSDDERVAVGKCYIRQGREEAIFLALQFVGPKLEHKALQLKEKIQGNEILIYCWRGGMRSDSMAWFFSLFGYEVFVLSGGYKSYRKYVKNSFSNKAKLIIIAGMTGSGKTELLESIKLKGCQVIDLEKLANHKGSVFGGLGMTEQPSLEQFENNLFDCWSTFDFNKPVFIEDESLNIGRLQVPPALYGQMQKAAAIEIQRDKVSRIAKLEIEYAHFDNELLKQCIYKLEKRLGKENTKNIIFEIENKNYSKAAGLLLIYYDKAYQMVMDKREKSLVKNIFLGSDDLEINSEKIINISGSIF
jgi:tRNA 2-selenouridine synthase